jgi:SAM-dependent methyltransferase
MSGLVQFLDKKVYGQFSNNWDDTLFRDRILSVIKQDSIVLDLGAGAGILQQMNFRGIAAKICGVDLDPRVLENPMLDEGRIADGESVPYPDAAFDVVFANNVLEHLPDPYSVLTEVARILKPGGVFMFKTPNAYHYVPILSRLTPHRFHQIVNKWRGRAEEDTFPTLYRANSAATIRRLATACGFHIDQLERIEGRPEYLRMNGATYLVGVAYERFVNSSKIFSPFRVLLTGALRKSK